MRLRKKVAKFGDNKEKQSHGRFSREFSGHLAARTRERNFLESFATPLQDWSATTNARDTTWTDAPGLGSTAGRRCKHARLACRRQYDGCSDREHQNGG
jgi:hypothetical protein